jgi:hypothetical protein
VRFKCFGCDASGDALSLIGQARGINPRVEFKALLIEAAQIAGLLSLAAELESGKASERREFVAPTMPKEPERSYPNASELAGLLGACRPVTKDPEISAHLEQRGIDPELVADESLAMALPVKASCPRWAGYQGSPWTETGHRLVLPVVGPSGGILSVRAWRVSEGDSPKRLPPGGCKASGLVLACPMTLAWLRGTWLPSRILIAEGEPDFLAAALWRTRLPYARLGIVSGSWTAEFSQKCCAGLDVYLWSDKDAAGDRYASEVDRSVRARGCAVHRWTPEAA